MYSNTLQIETVNPKLLPVTTENYLGLLNTAREMTALFDNGHPVSVEELSAKWEDLLQLIEETRECISNKVGEGHNLLINASNSLGFRFATILRRKACELIITDYEPIESLLLKILYFLESIGIWVENIEPSSDTFSLSQFFEKMKGPLCRDIEHKVNLDFDIDPELFISGQKGALFILINHLIENAVKYNVKRKNPLQIKVKAERKDDRIKIVVSDNGSGIAEENAGKIFMDGYSTSGEPDRGKGLAVVQEWVKVMEGNVSCLPHGGINGGAAFVLDFSAAETSSASSKPQLVQAA